MHMVSWVSDSCRGPVRFAGSFDVSMINDVVDPRNYL
jgi:hypothetical protein